MRPDDSTDLALMVAYRAGDSKAFELLYARYSGRVYAYLRKKLGSSEEIEEVFQSVFLKFHLSRDRYDPAYPVAQWIFVIARTRLLDHLRKGGRQVEIDPGISPDEIPDSPVSQTPGLPALNGEKETALLDALSAEQRRAVEMRVLDDLTYEEIAARLGKSEANIRQIVSRALRRLRGTLKTQQEPKP